MTLPAATANYFDLLTGVWRIERQIEDQHDLHTGSFLGEAAFTPSSLRLLKWAESGILTLKHYQNRVEAAYQIAFEDNSAPIVQFPDGRVFFPLDVQNGRCAINHPCGEDHYRGEWVFESSDRFTLFWLVTGPRKNYTVHSIYNRKT